MHGLVPPHPGPLVAIAALNANLGMTLAFGVLVAIPTVVIAGPLFARSPPAGSTSPPRTCSTTSPTRTHRRRQPRPRRPTGAPARPPR